jgi:RNA polymerase sigma factor (sigma-70 family)
LPARRHSRSKPSSSPRVEMAAQPDIETTGSLLAKVREGDEDARTRLVVRYQTLLRRWAHGRVPARARAHVDTDDLVQVTFLQALNKVGKFEQRRQGAFFAYLRTILLNVIRRALRRVDRQPVHEALPDELEAGRPTPLEEVISAEAVDSYEAALATLTEEQRQAVVLRVEMGFTYRQVAEAMGSPSMDAARMLVTRALEHLSEKMVERAR